MAKKQLESVKGGNALNSPEERKKFKASLFTVAQYFQLIDDQKESIKESVAELSSMYGLDKKIIRKMVVTLHKHSYSEVLEENRYFEELYEKVIEGRFRDDDDLSDHDVDSDEDSEDDDY